jgi:two-component system chemotaxis response regulator CheB
VEPARHTAIPTRVLVVDDSVVVRRMVGRAVEADPSMELAGVAANGSLALAKLAAVRPDVVVLDLEMPVMDGFETLAAIRRTHPDLPVIVFSHLTTRGARATLDAMALGATAFALKPNTENTTMFDSTGSGSGDGVGIGPELLTLIQALTNRSNGGSQAAPGRSSHRPSLPPSSAARVEVVAIGVSTGGPKALDVVLQQLPASLAVPVLVVQHMPTIFTRLLAERLDSRSALAVVEAEEGMVVRGGGVFVAPGGRHMGVKRAGADVRIVLSDGPPENGCRPAADVLFCSAVEVFGGRVLGVVLTGMGRDGLRGSEQVRAAGGAVVAQTPASSVVASMPTAVIEAGLADAVVGLDSVAGELLQRVNRSG